MEGRRKHQFIANLPSEARTIFTPGWRGYWQVFGLAGLANQKQLAFLLTHLPGS
jgi:hypothetical protein